MKNDYGSGTAIHPQTGELLALVSTPSYDVYPFMYGMSNEEYNKLTEDKKRTSAQQVPDYNFTRFNSKKY